MARQNFLTCHKSFGFNDLSDNQRPDQFPDLDQDPDLDQVQNPDPDPDPDPDLC
jgi:hypothetical protein